MKLTDITVERVLAAYEKTGIKPKKGTPEYDEHFHIIACDPLDLLYHIERQKGFLRHLRLKQAAGFLNGLDGDAYDSQHSDLTAYNLGREIANAVFRGVRK